MVTKEQLKSALKELGINKGMTLEVHSSLSSFGKLEGGALTVIDTLKELVTEDGSIFMPALRLSKELELTEDDKKLGMAYEKGLIKEMYIGDCKAMFFDIWSVVSLYENELRNDPYGLWEMKK